MRSEVAWLRGMLPVFFPLVLWVYLKGTGSFNFSSSKSAHKKLWPDTERATKFRSVPIQSWDVGSPSRNSNKKAKYQFLKYRLPPPLCKPNQWRRPNDEYILLNMSTVQRVQIVDFWSVKPFKTAAEQKRFGVSCFRHLQGPFWRYRKNVLLKCWWCYNPHEHNPKTYNFVLPLSDRNFTLNTSFYLFPCLLLFPFYLRLFL
jgi:hypothetical protein